MRHLTDRRPGHRIAGDLGLRRAVGRSAPDCTFGQV